MKYAADLNILDVPANCLVNPVNCQAHVLEDMQKPLKGLVLAYHKAFPGTQESYVKVCRPPDDCRPSMSPRDVVPMMPWSGLLPVHIEHANEIGTSELH